MTEERDDVDLELLHALLEGDRAQDFVFEDPDSEDIELVLREPADFRPLNRPIRGRRVA